MESVASKSVEFVARDWRCPRVNAKLSERVDEGYVLFQLGL
jgi:hypothetical protein